MKKFTCEHCPTSFDSARSLQSHKAIKARWNDPDHPQAKKKSTKVVKALKKIRTESHSCVAEISKRLLTMAANEVDKKTRDRLIGATIVLEDLR